MHKPLSSEELQDLKERCLDPEVDNLEEAWYNLCEDTLRLIEDFQRLKKAEEWGNLVKGTQKHREENKQALQHIWHKK